jgi:hypothetical protein
MGKGDTIINAVMGAIVTLILSFTGFAPLLGGAVAGYLQHETRRSGAKVGALSGALSFLPFLFFAFIFFGIFFAGPMMDQTMGTPGAPVLFIFLLVMVPTVLLWTVGLGALGGYLVVYLREDLARTDETKQSL